MGKSDPGGDFMWDDPWNAQEIDTDAAAGFAAQIPVIPAGHSRGHFYRQEDHEYADEQYEAMAEDVDGAGR